MIQPLHGHILLIGTTGFETMSLNIIQIQKFLIHVNSIYKMFNVCLCEKKKLIKLFKKMQICKKNKLKFY